MVDLCKSNFTSVFGLAFKNLQDNSAKLPENVQVDLRPSSQHGSSWNTDKTYSYFQKAQPANHCKKQLFPYLKKRSFDSI